MDDKLVQELVEKLNNLRNVRIDKLAEERTDFNNLVADIMNGLETLFIVVNSMVAQESKPQAAYSTFVSVSKPNESKVL